MDSEEEDIPSKEKDKDSEEIDEPENHAIFREVSEVRFPAEVGPLGTHRLCKIKCIDGMWQGPLCAAPDQEEAGLMKFEPLYKRCVVDQIPPHLLLSYKNVSVVSLTNFYKIFMIFLNLNLLRHSTGIYLMDTRCKHVAKILDFTSLLEKRKFYAQTVCGLQSSHNAYQRLFSRTTPTTAHRPSELKLELARLHMSHRVSLLCFQHQLYISIACIRVAKEAPSGRGPDGSANT